VVRQTTTRVHLAGVVEDQAGLVGLTQDLAALRALTEDLAGLADLVVLRALTEEEDLAGLAAPVALVVLTEEDQADLAGLADFVERLTGPVGAVVALVLLARRQVLRRSCGKDDPHSAVPLSPAISCSY
jgi:hypothetical protein